MLRHGRSGIASMRKIASSKNDFITVGLNSWYLSNLSPQAQGLV